MNGFAESQEFKTRLKEYQLLKNGMIEKIMQAAKLYIDTVDKMAGLENKSAIINQQNNYIQINGLQGNLQQLPADKLAQRAEIISALQLKWE